MLGLTPLQILLDKEYTGVVMVTNMYSKLWNVSFLPPGIGGIVFKEKFRAVSVAKYEHKVDAAMASINKSLIFLKQKRNLNG